MDILQRIASSDWFKAAIFGLIIATPICLLIWISSVLISSAGESRPSHFYVRVTLPSGAKVVHTTESVSDDLVDALAQKYPNSQIHCLNCTVFEGMRHFLEVFDQETRRR